MKFKTTFWNFSDVLFTKTVEADNEVQANDKIFDEITAETQEQITSWKTEKVK